MAHSSKRGRSSSSASSDDEAMANCLILLAQGPILPSSSPANSYECKTCSKCFSSFQALGGHRASHKKPKPSDLDPTASLPRPPPSSRTHECSVCGTEFSSGQALGGHMRRHRPDVAKPKRPLLSLDLNLPAPPDDDHFPFSLPPQPAVDCRY